MRSEEIITTVERNDGKNSKTKSNIFQGGEIKRYCNHWVVIGILRQSASESTSIPTIGDSNTRAEITKEAMLRFFLANVVK